MTNCQRCGSSRLCEVFAHSKDSSVVKFAGQEHDGYFPEIKNVCGNDDCDITVCLECGQLQGEWPVENPTYSVMECESCGEEDVEGVEFGTTTCPHCGDTVKEYIDPKPREHGGTCTVKIGTQKCRLLVPFEFEGLPRRPIGHEMVVESIGTDVEGKIATVTFCGYTLECLIGRDVELI